MLGLPQTTELNKVLPKKAIYAKFKMNTAAKAKFDADISRIVIGGELSEVTTSIAKGKEVSSVFLLQVNLKRKDYDPHTIAQLSRLIDQNMLFILDCEGQRKLAIYHDKLFETRWMPQEQAAVTLSGLNLDAVWENLIVQIGGITVAEGNTLDEQIAADERRAKLQKEIDKLEKLARTEKQPKKKFEIVQKIRTLELSILLKV